MDVLTHNTQISFGYQQRDMTTMDNVTHQRMVAIFNEWAERYVKNPADFDNVVDENGNVIKNYGERCAAAGRTFSQRDGR